MKCKDCCYFISEHGKYIQCELTNICIKKDIENVEEICKCFNKDLSQEKICFNCKHFLGGGDWGLNCANNYYKLTEALDKSCKNFLDKSTEM